MRVLIIIPSLLSILIGSTTLVGWLSDNLLMASVLPNTIPMAPSTALFFIAIGCLQLIIISPRRARKAKSITVFASNIILFYSLIIFIESLALETLHLEDFIFGNFGNFQNVPRGRMAPITAVLFVLQSLALLSRRCNFLMSRRRWRSVSSSLASIALITSFTLLLGYIHNTPLLYGGLVIPMALPTAIAFIFQSFSSVRKQVDFG